MFSESLEPPLQVFFFYFVVDVLQEKNNNMEVISWRKYEFDIKRFWAEQTIRFTSGVCETES